MGQNDYHSPEDIVTSVGLSMWLVKHKTAKTKIYTSVIPAHVFTLKLLIVKRLMHKILYLPIKLLTF